LGLSVDVEINKSFVDIHFGSVTICAEVCITVKLKEVLKRNKERAIIRVFVTILFV
jgi:hypothetical protein